MQPPDLQVLEHANQVINPRAGTLRVTGVGAVMSPPRIRDHAVAGLHQYRLLIFPEQRAAGIRVHEDHGFAATARVPVPQSRTADVDPSLDHRSLFGRSAPGVLRWQHVDFADLCPAAARRHYQSKQRRQDASGRFKALAAQGMRHSRNFQANFSARKKTCRTHEASRRLSCYSDATEIAGQLR